MVLAIHSGAWILAGRMGSVFGCGVTDQVRRTRKFFVLGPPVQVFRSGQTVVKVCCWHQERSESALVRFPSFCNS